VTGGKKGGWDGPRSHQEREYFGAARKKARGGQATEKGRSETIDT